jgi:hypothetical protein
MKRTPLLLFLLGGTASTLSAQVQDYNTFIRQTQQTTKVVWDMPVSTLEGNSLAPMSLEGGGALFQLYALKKTGSPSYLLAQQLVGAYLPKATVKILTEDPYPKEVCTRADRPFTAQITVEGLLSGPDVPEAATKVLLQRYAVSYPSTGTLTMSQIVAKAPLSTSYLVSNGVSKTPYPATAILPDFTKAYGEEHFIIHALADGNVSQTEISAGYVRIFPMATGKILGITEGQKIGATVPSLTLPLVNLYPRSTTWVQIYPGPYVKNKEGVVVDVPLTREGNDPYTDTRTISNWDSVIKEDGIYTLELLTKTAFDTQSLHRVTFELKRSIRIRSTLVDIK